MLVLPESAVPPTPEFPSIEVVALAPAAPAPPKARPASALFHGGVRSTQPLTSPRTAIASAKEKPRLTKPVVRTCEKITMARALYHGSMLHSRMQNAQNLQLRTSMTSAGRPGRKRNNAELQRGHRAARLAGTGSGGEHGARCGCGRADGDAGAPGAPGLVPRPKRTATTWLGLSRAGVVARRLHNYSYAPSSRLASTRNPRRQLVAIHSGRGTGGLELGPRSHDVVR